MRPWHTLASVDTKEGPLSLRQRGERDFLITISGRVLMTSQAHRSEDELARLSCAHLNARSGKTGERPRVLIGGLGMGYTLRAALDVLPRQAEVTVAELNADVVGWCRGPLAVLTDRAVLDPRVRVEIADVARVIAAARRQYHAIVLDLYEGPHHALNGANDPLYGLAALSRTHDALVPGGVLAVWAEEADRPFAERMTAAGFRVSRHKSGGGRVHVIYLGETGRADPRPGRSARPAKN